MSMQLSGNVFSLIMDEPWIARIIPDLQRKNKGTGMKHLG